MKRTQLFGIFMVAAVAVGFVASGASLAATEGQGKPTFNSKTGILHWSTKQADGSYKEVSEKDFLRWGERGKAGDTFETCQDGKVIDLYFYVHNSAPKETNNIKQEGEAGYNATTFDGPGVARNTKVRVDVPTAQAAKSHTLSATISADNATSVVDTATIKCDNGKKITLEPMFDSVGVSLVRNTVQYKNQPGEAPESPEDFKISGDLSKGAPVGYLGGLVPGCWKYSFRVVNAKVKVSVYEEPQQQDPPVVQPPATQDPPVKDGPDTGVAGASLALAAVGSVAAGVSHRVVLARRARR